MEMMSKAFLLGEFTWFSPETEWNDGEHYAGGAANHKAKTASLVRGE